MSRLAEVKSQLHRASFLLMLGNKYLLCHGIIGSLGKCGAVCKLGNRLKPVLRHPVFTHEHRLFLLTTPVIKTVIVKGVWPLVSIIIRTSIWRIAIYHAVRLNLDLREIKRRGDKTLRAPPNSAYCGAVPDTGDAPLALHRLHLAGS